MVGIGVVMSVSEHDWESYAYLACAAGVLLGGVMGLVLVGKQSRDQ